MTHLREEERTRGELAGQPVPDWLTGDNSRVSIGRPFSIYNTINLTNAKLFIESIFERICHLEYLAGGTAAFTTPFDKRPLQNSWKS